MQLQTMLGRVQVIHNWFKITQPTSNPINVGHENHKLTQSQPNHTIGPTEGADHRPQWPEHRPKTSPPPLQVEQLKPNTRANELIYPLDNLEQKSNLPQHATK